MVLHLTNVYPNHFTILPPLQFQWNDCLQFAPNLPPVSAALENSSGMMLSEWRTHGAPMVPENQRENHRVKPMGFLNLPSGYVKIAIEAIHRNSCFTNF